MVGNRMLNKDKGFAKVKVTFDEDKFNIDIVKILEKLSKSTGVKKECIDYKIADEYKDNIVFFNIKTNEGLYYLGLDTYRKTYISTLS